MIGMTTLITLGNWIDEKGVKKFTAPMLLKYLSEASDYAIQRKLTKVELTEMTDPKQFMGVITQLLQNRFFRITHLNLARYLDKGALVYRDYLMDMGQRINDNATESKQESIVNNAAVGMSIETAEQGDRSKSVRVPWDKYETALLIEAFWKIENDKQSRSVVLQELSDSLRKKAVNQGIAIDDTFRNLNGMQIQLSCIAVTFYPNRPAMHKNAIMEEMADLYKKDRAAFNLILAEAHKMVAIEDNCSAKGKLSSILKNNFPYGLKISSSLDLMRLRVYAQDENVVLPEDDGELLKMLLDCGSVIDGKLIIKDENLTDELSKIVETAFSTGAHIIYYDSLFYTNQEWMMRHHINSEDTLKEYMKKNLPNYVYTRVFFSMDEKQTEYEAVSGELRRIWSDNAVEELTYLFKELPYIPQDNIQRVLFAVEDFVWVSENRYLLLDRFLVPDHEENDILTYVSNACELDGYASLTDVPLGSIPELNYQVTGTALYTAIFNKVLKGKYHNNHRIITVGKSDLNIVKVLSKAYAQRDEITLEEVTDKVTELNGGLKQQDAFEVLYNGFIRISKSKFICRRKVHFNVDEIDSILIGIYTKGYGAIRDVGTFAMFPECGVTWNHYVLESYCYSYSRKFSLLILNFNSKNAGAIAESKYSYNDVLALSLSESNLDFTEESAGDYLFQKGLMAKRKYYKLGEIINKAAEIKREKK